MVFSVGGAVGGLGLVLGLCCVGCICCYFRKHHIRMRDLHLAEMAHHMASWHSWHSHHSNRHSHHSNTELHGMSPLVSPPNCHWAPGAGKQFACFLSHFKVEAGSDARYLKDLLQRMLGCPVFLDSNELADLRHLFGDGVHQSDTLVLLGTENVLTRPWCLLELWESVKEGVPVVVVSMERGGFHLSKAIQFVEALEVELPKRNPGAMDIIDETLREQKITLDTFKQGIIDSLRPALPPPPDPLLAASEVRINNNASSSSGDGLEEGSSTMMSPVGEQSVRFTERSEGSIGGRTPGGKSKGLVWHAWGTDNQLLADATDLIEAMGRARGTHVQWKRTHRESHSEASMRKKDDHLWLPRRRVSSLIKLMGASSSVIGSHHGDHDSPLSPDGQEKQVSQNSRVRRRAEYAAFISYYRAEAGADARRLQTALEGQLGSPVFLDVAAADRIDEILTRGVARSGALILLQTQGVLTRPWCLLELFWAIRCQIPIVPIFLRGDGYDYEEARKLLNDLPAELEKKNPGAVKELEERLEGHNLTIDELATAIRDTLPNIISTSFDPEGSDNHVSACLSRLAHASPLTLTCPFSRPSPGASRPSRHCRPYG